MCLLWVDECVYEVDRVSVYSGLSGRATETVALHWIFKEPNLLLNSFNSNGSEHWGSERQK